MYLVSVPYEITLLSNPPDDYFSNLQVSVPYEITLLSNTNNLITEFQDVSVPYEITLLSNPQKNKPLTALFQYLMKLHYSQTVKAVTVSIFEFQYLMKLHYSQTSNKLRHYNAQGNNIRYIYYTI